MEELLGLTVEELYIVVLAIILFLFFVVLVMNISNRVKIKRLKSKYNRLLNGLSNADMEGVLENCFDRINEVTEKCKDLEYRVNSVERDLTQCIQKVSVIRYNAFDNVGSELSFSVALLNENDDGLVLSSLYSRDSSLIYAKPVIRGNSKYTLTAEELQAIETAKKRNIVGKYSELEE